MDHFNYHNSVLHAEAVDLQAIASRFGTPCYVYSRATLERHWRAFDSAFANSRHLICYAVKANSNLALLNVLTRLGSGFDIVSVGELERVLAAGGDPDKVVFSGVGKRIDEMRRALEVGIHCFNVESESELEQLDQLARGMGKVAAISLRVNPDVDAQTHPYISTGLKENKFGIDIDQALRVYQRAAGMEGVRVIGVDCHIGSQLTQLSPFTDALDRLLHLVAELDRHGIAIEHIDLGGGLGIPYQDEAPPEPAHYSAAVSERLQGLPYTIIIEPGRAIAGNAGILLTRVEYLKCTPHKNFAVVDAAMNDLLRPAFYQSWQAILPVLEGGQGETRRYDVVGPICETGDWLGKDRDLSIMAGDLLAVRSAGAYGFVMSSNYNTRPRAAEVMVDGDQAYLVRERESVEELFAGEHLLPGG